MGWGMLAVIRHPRQDPPLMPTPPKTDEWKRGPEADEPAGPKDDTSEGGTPPPWKVLAATALVATVLGAGIGTAMTLLVGEPGPPGDRGAQGEPGPRGPQGPQGPAADTSGIESAVDDLSGQVADLQSRVDALEGSSADVSADDIAELEDRITQVEDLLSALCFELDFDC